MAEPGEVLHGDFILRDGTYVVPPEPAPSARAVTLMVDETAKSIMRMQGRDPERWDRLTHTMRDELRLLALDRLRSLA